MCGIVGQVKAEGAPERALLEAMCSALEHRGPDSRGVCTMGPAGLGIQRLRIIDLETGDQPIYNEDGTVAVVLNGEIYNHRELREDLRRRGHSFSTLSDTEVIVHLYEEKGRECVKDLQGMFGFALWDDRRRSLLLARDRVGKKPLFYAHADGELSFASELNALMRNPAVPRDLDHEALDAYFAYGYVPAPFSAFAAVRKLPPACTLVHDGDGIRIERYWSLDYSTKRESRDPRELHEELRETIRAAVRRRMISDVPLGVFLSGGIDSSVVVAAMAEASSEPVKSFSIGFTSDSFNELPHARRIAEQFATDHHEFLVEPDAVEMVPRIARQYGEPFADASAVPSFYLAELARRHVTVALNGDGGDESFAGYDRYVANLLLARLRAVPGPLRRVVGRGGESLPRGARVNDRLSRVRRLSIGLGLEPPARYAAYQSYLDGLERDRLYCPQYRSLLGESAPGSVIEDAWAATAAPSLLDSMLGTDVATYLPGDLLVKMDIATMAYSLEGRSPLLDPEVMQLAASLPPELKVRGLQKKVVLRDALRGWLPDTILDRPKQGFELPIAHWFRSELREFTREVLFDGAARERGYFDREYVSELFDQHVSGRRDNAKPLWNLLMFELWHRDVVDASASVAPLAAGT